MHVEETDSSCTVAMALVRRIDQLAVKAGVVDYRSFKRKDIQDIEEFVGS